MTKGSPRLRRNEAPGCAGEFWPLARSIADIGWVMSPSWCLVGPDTLTKIKFLADFASILLVVAKAIVGDGGLTILMNSLWEVGGAVAVGAAVGVPAAFLTGRLQDGEPIQTEALSLVFLCAGMAIWLEVSYLLAGMVAGAVVVNLAKHHNRPFHEIERIEWPFMVLFFVLAGAALNLSSLQTIGIIGVAYIFFRTLSRVFGGWLGATMAGAPSLHRSWIGVALVPQAGVALGMALIAGNHLPDLKETLLAVAIGSTVVFEVAGPVLTQLALRQVGEGDHERH